MSSEGARYSNEGRCLFCNLGCRLRLEQFAPQRWRPTYNDSDRLCARGQMLADLVHHPERLYRPSMNTKPVALETALRCLADRLVRGGPASLSIWLDGNTALEDLTAARLFVDQWKGSSELLVHLPPHERGAVEGLDVAGVEPVDPEQWHRADAFLVIGNPLASHPPIAPHLLRWGKERTSTPLVVVDSAAGVTDAYTPHALRCRPGYEYWVTAAMIQSVGAGQAATWLPDGDSLRQVVDDSGVDPQRVDRAANLLRSAHRPAVIIAPASGAAERWRTLTAAASVWAAAKGGMVSVLTSCANALAVSRYTRRFAIKDWATVQSQVHSRQGDILLILGWDPSSAYPRTLWESSVKTAQTVVMANPFAPMESGRVAHLFPLALGSERGGTYVLADGKNRVINPLLSPPAGVLTIAELFMLLARYINQSGDGSMDLSNEQICVSPGDYAPVKVGVTTEIPAPPKASTATGWPAVLTGDPTHYFDGQITRRSRWSRQMNWRPELHISAADARALGLRDGGPAEIRNERGRAVVRVLVSRDQPEVGGCLVEAGPDRRTIGWLAVSGCAAEIRRLADWNFAPADASAAAGVIHVNVQPIDATDADEAAREAVYADA